MITSGDIFEGIAAVSALGATMLTAISAYFAGRAVQEASAARKEEISPRLVLEQNFEGFHFTWPGKNSSNSGPDLFARLTKDQSDFETPSFTLTNHGGGPALEVQIVFELEDPNNDLTVPKGFEQFGLSIWEEPPSEAQPAFKVLSFNDETTRTGSGLPLYKKQTTDLSNCAPSQTRVIEFPHGLMTRLFLRGVQSMAERSIHSTGILPLTLKATLTCHSIAGARYETQFRFEANMFNSGQLKPLTVYGHFRELPMYPTIEGYRVE